MPATASGMTISLPGGITSSDVVSFTVNSSGGGTIDVTPLTQADGTARTYIGTPIGTTMEVQVSYMGSGAPCDIGATGTVTIGSFSFTGVCTSSSGTAAVNDVARFDATFKKVN